MDKDPLSFFLNEKTAADSAPSTAMDPIEQKPFTANPDPESIDPGERAVAGIIAGAGVLGGGFTRFITNYALRNAALSGSVGVTRQLPWQPSASMAAMPEGATKGKVLGLFNVESRVPKFPRAADLDIDMVNRTGRAAVHPVSQKMLSQADVQRKIGPVVDSFIDKHNLGKKGVTVSLKQGPLNFMGGPRYEVPTRRVYLPDLSKETALHELGHAADYTKGRVGRFRGIAEPVMKRGVQVGLSVALIAGDRIKEILPGTVDDRAIKYMQDHAPEIMGATLAATTLYPEAKASIMALQHIAKTEGRQAAIKSMPRLGAGWASYVLGAIPAIVGMSLARRYMREARGEKMDTDEFVAAKLRDLEKTGGLRGLPGPLELLSSFGDLSGMAARAVRSHGRDIHHVGAQIVRQSDDLIRQPGTLKRIGAAAKEVGTDPSFVYGAVTSALPAAMASVYLYGSVSGKEVRKRMDPAHVAKTQSGIEGKSVIATRSSEEWREKNPLLFSGLVAAGAAMSGGIMTKLFSDLARVL